MTFLLRDIFICIIYFVDVLNFEKPFQDVDCCLMRISLVSIQQVTSYETMTVDCLIMMSLFY